jgi:N-acetylglucosamine-6-phosphate deacetylase
MLTLNPAGLLGVEFKKGALRVGADADVVLMDHAMQISGVWVRGMAVN